MLCLQQLLEIYRPLPKNNHILSYQTLPKTPDIVSIPLEESPEYGSTDEFLEEMCAISQKRAEEEYQQLPKSEQTTKKEKYTPQFALDFSKQWKKYPEEMRKWTETPKNVPDFIKKCALEFQNKEPQQSLLENNTVPKNKQKVFISYSYDDTEHEQWIEKFAIKLRERNVDVIFDKWHTKLGQSLTNFMEQSVSSAQRVICVLTPNYKKKADKLDGGVGYEYSIVTSEILKQGSTTKFIPLLKSGNDNDAIPISLSGRKYLDVRNDEDFDKNVNNLLEDLNS